MTKNLWIKATLASVFSFGVSSGVQACAYHMLYSSAAGASGFHGSEAAEIRALLEVENERMKAESQQRFLSRFNVKPAPEDDERSRQDTEKAKMQGAASSLPP